MMKKTGILIAAAGIFFSLFPVLAGIFHAGSFVLLIASLTLLAGCLLNKRVLENRKTRAVMIFIQVCYCVFLLVTAVGTGMIYKETRNLPDENSECTMVVLGCGLKGERPSRMLEQRLLKAEAFLKEHPEIPVIVSGGQGSDEVIPEAQAMRNWLIARGIEEERIYTEDRSASTRENLSFSKEVIKAHGLPEEIVIVTNFFHSCRAGMIAAKQGYEYRSLPAGTTWFMIPVSVMREVLGIVYEYAKAPGTF